MFADLRFRVRALFGGADADRDLHDELSAHLEALARKHEAAGLRPEAAARRARLEFGGAAQIADACRDSRGTAFVENLVGDIRFAVRLLRKDLFFNAIAVLTLALGIGASTTVFSVVHRLLLEPLPYPTAERIVLPWRQPPAGVQIGFDDLPWGRYDFLSFASQTQAFAAIGAFVGDGFNLAGSGEPVRLEGARVSAGFFASLAVAPELGRTFRQDEDVPGRALVCVLSHRVWQERFGRDPSIIGRSIRLSGQSYTVVGVMPARFAFPRSAELPGSVTLPAEPQVWVPIALPPGPPHRGEPSELGVVGRLKDGDPGPAQAELNLFARRFEAQFPHAKGWWNTRLVPLPAQIVGDTRRPLLLLLAAVGLVLLIGCANVAHLLLVRSVARERELSLRIALGAARARVAQQLITESLVLAVTGGAGGVAVAWLGTRAVKAFGPASVPRLQDVSLEPVMILFALGLAFAAGTLFGVLPALGAVRAATASARATMGRSKGSPRHSRARRLLLTGEVALALVLVIASGLLLRTFVHLLRVDAGFRADRVLTFELTLPDRKYPDPDRMVALYTAALDRIRALPGVEAAAIGETIPMGGAGESTGLRVPNRPAASEKDRPYANYTVVSPGYFRAVGTPLLRGRDFLPTDAADAPLVAIVSRAMAEKFWPGQDAIGKAVGVPIVKTDMTVVGVAADVKHVSLRESPSPEVYVPYTQKPWPSLATMHVAVRSAGEADGVLSGIRRALAAIDPELPIANVATLSQVVDASVAQPRFSMLLLTAFAGLSLVLASVGLYGAVSYTVVQRTPELGVRLALGARRRDILATVLGEGMQVACAGTIAGVVSAWAAMRLLGNFLYGVEATDALTFAATSLLLLAVAATACYLPARRAAAIDPLTAMRTE